jgi:HAD superfamily hydrolase (TIGR01509 family)
LWRRSRELRGVTLGDRFIRDLEAKESELVRRSVQPVEGVRGAVTDIIDSGFATCVASNGTLAAMRERLTYAGLMDLFTDRLFSAEQVPRGKPSPDVFLHAAASIGYSPHSCIVVEDSLVGVVAGRAAGMRMLAFATPSRLALAPARGGWWSRVQWDGQAPSGSCGGRGDASFITSAS